MYPYRLLKPLLSRNRNVSYFMETHVLPQGSSAIKVMRSMDGVVVSSRKLARDMQQILGFSPDSIQPAYLASNALTFSGTKEEARSRLGLDTRRHYAIYTGKLVLSEVCLMLDAARHLQTLLPSVDLIFVGGNPDIIKQCEKEVADRALKNVRFTGFVSPAEVATYQIAADVLLLYLVKNRDIIDYITPSKLFDYLQAGRPIIASNYPILHEILENDANALFIEPHAPDKLAAEIARVINTPALAERLSENAKASSRQYSWKSRVELIWNFIQRRSSALATAGVRN